MSQRANKNVYLVACGGHGRVVLDALTSSNKKISGIIDSQLEPGSEIFGVKVSGDDSFLKELNPLETILINGLGSTGSTRGRIEIYERFTQLGFVFEGTVHPAASVGAECRINQSAQIMAGAVLQNRVEVGENVVVNTRASVDHDVVISAHAVVSPGAIISGAVKLGRGAFVGAGAVIIQGIEIGESCVIGAGAVVRHHVKANTTVVGNPAAQLE
jgi:UDP-perosamine 4-acetyltransferase